MKQMKFIKIVKKGPFNDEISSMKKAAVETKVSLSKQNQKVSIILNEKVRSPGKSNSKPKVNSIYSEVKKKLTTDDVKKNILSPSDLTKNYSIKHSTIDEYKKIRFAQPNNLKNKSKELHSKENKNITINQTEKSLTPIKNKVNSKMPDLYESKTPKKKVFNYHNFPITEKISNKADIKFDTISNDNDNVNGRNKILVTKASLIGKLEKDSYLKENFLNNKPNLKKKSQKINLCKNLIKNKNVKKVTISQYSKRPINFSKSPSKNDFDKYSSFFNKDSKNKMNLKVTYSKIPLSSKPSCEVYKNKDLKENLQLSKVSLFNNEKQIALYSRNKTDGFQKKSSKVFQTLQQINNPKYQVNLNNFKEKNNKFMTKYKIFSTLINLDINNKGNKLILIQRKFDDKRKN